MAWPIDKIINVAYELHHHGATAASTSERIAGAFVINRMDCLPPGYDDVLDAWDRLGPEWQALVRTIKREHLHHIIDDE